MSDYQVVNSRLPRLDAPAKATGRAVFIDDISFPGMLHAALLQSPLPHARIRAMDTSKAERLPGVKAVITAKDAGLVRYGVSPARYDETVFCHDRVRYVGDEIAAVAAIDQETAEEAVGLISVDYEELPAVLTIEEAMVEGAPQLHADFPRNISAEVHQEFGDVAEALKACDLIKTTTFKNKRQDGAFLEPPGCIAVFDLDGRLTLHSSTQAPHYVQRTVAMVLGLPVGKVRVVKPYVGGGFGIKAAANTGELAACLLARKTGKPVKFIYSREQVFMLCRARHQFVHRMTTGVKKDGNLAISLYNEDTTVLLVDGNLQFGDVAVFLNEQSKYSVVDLTSRADELDVDVVENVTVKHSQSGVKVLAAPNKPEQADTVTGEQFGKMLHFLKTVYSYVIVDTTSSLQDITLAAIDSADILVLVTTQDIPSIKSCRLFLDVANAFGMDRSRIVFVMNKFDKRIGITPEKVGDNLKQEVLAVIPFEERVIVSVNKGIPFLVADKSRPISRAILTLAEVIRKKVLEQEMQPEQVSSLRKIGKR